MDKLIYIESLKRIVSGLLLDIKDLERSTATPREIGIGLVNRSIEIKSLGIALGKEQDK